MTPLLEAKKGVNTFISGAISIVVFLFLGSVSSGVGLVSSIAAQEIAGNW